MFFKHIIVLHNKPTTIAMSGIYNICGFQSS